METLQQQPTSEGEARLTNGRYVLDNGATQNRTTYIVNDDGDDPLDLSVNKTKTEEKPADPVPSAPPTQDAVVEAPVQEEKPGDEKSTEVDAPETEKPAYNEEFLGSLDEVLMTKAGVNLDGVVQALVELLTWRNDILSLEANNAPVPASVTPTPPSFQRSQGRSPAPATAAYDFTTQEIAAMDAQTYAKRSQEITNAFMNGRVLKN